MYSNEYKLVNTGLTDSKLSMLIRIFIKINSKISYSENRRSDYNKEEERKLGVLTTSKRGESELVVMREFTEAG